MPFDETGMQVNAVRMPKGRTAKINAIVVEVVGLITERSIELEVGPSDVRVQVIAALRQMEAEHQERKSRDRHKREAREANSTARLAPEAARRQAISDTRRVLKSAIEAQRAAEIDEGDDDD